jgi:hypothetical protein
MHPAHGRTRGGPARRLKITSPSTSISARRSAVRLHHRVRGGQTPDHRPTVTMPSLAKVPLTVLSFRAVSLVGRNKIVELTNGLWFQHLGAPSP